VLDAVSSVTTTKGQGRSVCLTKDRIRILLNQSDCLFHSGRLDASLAVLQTEASAAAEILNKHALSCKVGSLSEDSSFLLEWICSSAWL